MKNGSNKTLDTSEDKVAARIERAKKLYRYISDSARRVGEMTTSSSSITDLFSMHIEIQRQKLRDNCEKLLFLDPLNYGKKAIDMLWRKVYYDTVSAAKKLRETDTENDSYLFTHIVCGIGHFHNFITRIQTEMTLHYKELDYVSAYNDEECQVNSDPLPEDELQFGKSILYTCLIYLGDLSRYQTEIFQTFDSSIAARYYLQAAHIDMCSGMPYNQLANLYLDKNFNIDSVCYYIHCLNCTVPFEGAMDNLKKIFEKNTQVYDTINNSQLLTQTEHIQNTIVNFLSLIELWYLSKNDTNIPQRCSTIAQGLKVSMDFDKSPMPDPNTSYDEYIQAVEEENTNPTYLNPNLVHKIVQICLFTIPKISETDETKAFACKAFTLALLSQLLLKLLSQLQSIGLQNPASKYRGRTVSIQETDLDVVTGDNVMETIEQNHEPDVQPMINGDHSYDNCEKNIEENDNITNGDIKNKKTILKRRRRRRVVSSESSDESGAETENSDIETFESYSEGESDSETLPSEEDSQSDDSGEGTEAEDNVKCNGEVTENIIENMKEPLVNGNAPTNANDTKNIDKVNDLSKELNEKELKNFLLGDNMLSSIKLLEDWALAEKDLILSCGDSGEALFQCVVDLLNIFMHNFIHETYNNNDDSEVLKYAKSIAKRVKLEYKTIPLPEDINLRGTNICKFDKDAAEWQTLDRHKLSVYEENVIRILNFIDFGNFIANIVPRIRFNRTMKIFYLKKIPSPKLTTKINHKRSREWHNSKINKHQSESSEGGLLRRLGRLWLVSQVRELERSGRQPPTPALLALDTAALNKHLRRVKQLLRARNFILLIPTVVLQELDDLKREESSARDAIRWLELQLKTGSRFLRAQRPGQSRALPLLKCPRKAPPHIHNFMQILEFCNHFIGEDKQNSGGSGDAEVVHVKATPLLVLLMGNKTDGEDDRYKEFSVTGAAKSVGVSVEYIEDFYSKWRQTVHKSGKKR